MMLDLILAATSAYAGYVIAECLADALHHQTIDQEQAERQLDDYSWRAMMRRQAVAGTTGYGTIPSGELVVLTDDWVLLGEVTVIARREQARRELALIDRVFADLFRPVTIGRPPVAVLDEFAQVVRPFVTAERRVLAVAA